MKIELLDIVIFLQENAEFIKLILMNISSFLIFFIIMNRVFNTMKIRIEDIERNTNIMKDDFRIIKKHFETENAELVQAKKRENLNIIITKMLYENQSVIRSEFVVVKNNKIQLSSMGYIVSVEVGLTQMIDKNWNNFSTYLQDIEKKQGTHPYDLQYHCFYMGSCWEQFLSAEDISTIKHYAYEEGHIVSAYAPILGILIRDRYFQNIAPIPPFKKNR